MKILAIESSSLVASTAIVEDDVMVAEYTMNYKKTHSQTLLPMIDEMCKMTDYHLEEIDAIAVSGGPGSFTGLRIGSATAKGLGFVLKKPLIHVPTVEAMAYNFYDTYQYVVPIMDARRGQVYTGIYESRKGIVTAIKEQGLVMMDELLSQLNDLGHEAVFLGDAVPVFREKIDREAKFPVSYAPANLNRQKAGSVALLGMKYYKEGKIQTAAEHVPDYLRPSQAERERQG